MLTVSADVANTSSVFTWSSNLTNYSDQFVLYLIHLKRGRKELLSTPCTYLWL